MSSWLRQYGGTILLVILAFAYLTRMYRLNLPEKYMFDEVYHAVTAKLIAQNDPRAYEWWNPPPEPNTAVDWLHPPLAKYFQALSIVAFGENSFGWRFSSVVFGTMVIVLVYHLSYQLTQRQGVALTAAALASFDGLLLVQSRIAMNDIDVTFFILLTLLLYLKYRQNLAWHLLLLTGISLGLAMASKWSGIFILFSIWFFEILQLKLFLFQINWKKWREQLLTKKNLNQSLQFLGFLVVMPVLVYILSYTQMFLQGKDWHHFVKLHQQIIYYQTHLKETHPYQSRPLQWALDLRPVWYNVEYLGPSRSDIYAFGNPILYWAGLLAVIALLLTGVQTLFSRLTVKGLKLKKIIILLLKAALQSPVFVLLSSYFAVWLPWQFSPRIMFFYHYTPAVPFLCILLSIQLSRLYQRGGVYQLMVIGLVSSIFVCFLIWYPHLVGIPVANQLANWLYFGIKSWK
ncbi:MAG: hypothetical protein COY81_02645 [Candidatus Pacebacteria bacterium CG_4_10_14_0_8_um_filter_43_12]|nr:MAG: hypothetical protein COY81_02645 [Candidatus Pacebacteria bacterium CG_4_10_14_0_8_um_filter_43_12]